MNDEEVIQALNEEIDDLYKMIEEKDKKFERLAKGYFHLLGKLNEAHEKIKKMEDKHAEEQEAFSEEFDFAKEYQRRKKEREETQKRNIRMELFWKRNK